MRDWTGYNDYHSIQVSLNRRFAQGFAFGVAYTGQHRQNLTLFDPFLNEADNRERNYNYSTNGGNQSRPHSLVINYNWEIPRMAEGTNAIIRGILDGWQVSGVTVMQNQQRNGFSYAFTGAPTNDLSGNGYARRVSLVCDPNLPRSERTFDRQFRTECVRPGGGPDHPYYMGTSTNDEYTRPGYINHDITLFKNFRMGGRATCSSGSRCTTRSTRPSTRTRDTAAMFDYATGVQNDTNFGRVTGVRRAPTA